MQSENYELTKWLKKEIERIRERERERERGLPITRSSFWLTLSTIKTATIVKKTFFLNAHEKRNRTF